MASVLSWVAVLLSAWFLGVLLKSVGKKQIQKASPVSIEQISLVNVLYRPVAQIAELLQPDPAEKLEDMNLACCVFGCEAGVGFLGPLTSDHVYRFKGQACKVVHVPTLPLPMSGAVVYIAADSVQKVVMKIDALMKICFSIGVLFSKVISDQHIIPPNELERGQGSLANIFHC